MTNEQSQIKEILEKIKILLALAPAGALLSMFIYAIIDVFDWSISINFWLLSMAWVFLLWFFVENSADRDERRNRVSTLWMCVFLGSLYTLFSLSLLGLLLKLILDIDITKFEKFTPFIFIVLIGWVMGLHIWFWKQKEMRHSEEVKINQSSKIKAIQFLSSPFRKKEDQFRDQGKAQKQLMFLINTEGKTSKQIKDEGWEAFQKYENVKAQAESQSNSSIPPKKI